MNGAVRILIVEDEQVDIAAIRQELDAHYDEHITRIAHNRADYEDALKTFHPNIILSNYKIPAFNWDDAYRIKQEMAPGVPFILLSDTMEAEGVLDLIKAGVADCVFHDKPDTLIPKIVRALKNAEKCEAEKALLDVMAKKIQSLRTVFDNTDIGFLFLSEHGVLLAYNKVSIIWSKNSYGVDIHEGLNFEKILLPERLPAFHMFFQKVVGGEDITYETSYPQPNGKLMWFTVNGKVIKEGEVVVGVCIAITDITDRKFAEENINKLNGELKAVNNQLTAILNALPANIALLNPTGKVMAVNEAWKKFALDNNMIGPEYGIGENYITICENAVGMDAENALDMAAGIKQVLSGELVDYSLEYPCHSLIEKRWFRAEVRLYVDGYIGVVVMHIDITARMLAELAINKLNVELEARVLMRTNQLTEANASLEAFSYSVSHDLRSPVRSLMGFAKIIHKKYGESLNLEVIELLGYIESNSMRMNNIIDNLLNLAKYGKAQLNIREVDIHALFADAWQRLIVLTGSTATLQLHEIPRVYADGLLIQQVIINLLSNAIKYTSKRASARVEVGSMQDCDTITIYVKDNGVGFDMKYYKRLFGAFQRLHGVTDFEGTGIGLTIIKRIVEKHGGTVWAEGDVDNGAAFFFSLPLNRENLDVETADTLLIKGIEA